jgi:hypothetical protein
MPISTHYPRIKTMKLNSLLLLPAIIAVGIMPIVSISLFDSQPAFSKEETKSSTPTPQSTNPRVKVKNERGLGSGSGSGAGSQINNQQPGVGDSVKCLEELRVGIVSAECRPGGSSHERR